MTPIRSTRTRMPSRSARCSDGLIGRGLVASYVCLHFGYASRRAPAEFRSFSGSIPFYELRAVFASVSCRNATESTASSTIDTSTRHLQQDDERTRSTPLCPVPCTMASLLGEPPVVEVSREALWHPDGINIRVLSWRRVLRPARWRQRMLAGLVVICALGSRAASRTCARLRAGQLAGASDMARASECHAPR